MLSEYMNVVPLCQQTNLNTDTLLNTLPINDPHPSLKVVLFGINTFCTAL